MPSKTDLKNYHRSFQRILRFWTQVIRIPMVWMKGYSYLKVRYIERILSDSEILHDFSMGLPLPEGYGSGIDERCIEYPWFYTKASRDAIEYLDAGSCLNNRLIMKLPIWEGKRLTILTLAPEPVCYWKKRISYQFSDLRKLPYREDWFDEIACLSTLEHVGMDNFSYSKNLSHREKRIRDFEKVLLELRRVLKPGGRLIFSVPFGTYQDWGMFQQFDEGHLERAAEVFRPNHREDIWYRYFRRGWQIAKCDGCENAKYSEFIVRMWQSKFQFPDPEPDLAMGARAVACCIWQKD